MIQKSTAEVKVPKKIVDQVIGQENAINIIKKAARQHRHVLLIGEPGTGKSLVGQALAETMPIEKLVDVLVLPNPTDENTPLIKTVPKGQGKQIVTKAKLQAMSSFKNQNILIFVFIIIVSLLPYYFWKTKQISDVVYAASMISSMVFIVGFILFINIGKRMRMTESQGIPKLLIDNAETKNAPFYDATGSHAGALLGDCLHDPLQSFSGDNKILLIKITGNKNNQIILQEISFTDKVEEILNKKRLIDKDSYKAAFLNKDELIILAESNGDIKPVEVLSVNKYKKKGNLIKITTESGKELLITPEHKVAVQGLFSKIKYRQADTLKQGHKIITVA